MKFFQAITVIATASIIALGCAGGKPYDPGIEDPTNTGFAINPVPAQTVVIGDTAIFPVTVVKSLLAQEGTAFGEGAVTLSVDGLPGDATANFTVNPVDPTFDGTNLELRVQTDVQTGEKVKASEIPQPETFTLTITGTNGHETHSVTTTLTINPFEIPDDFTIDPVPERTVFFGDLATFPITVKRVIEGGSGRAASNVTLSVTGGQPGSTSSFTVNPVLPTLDGATSKLKIQTDNGGGQNKTNGLQEGDFPVTITGTDGVHTHSVTTTLHLRFD